MFAYEKIIQRRALHRLKIIEGQVRGLQKWWNPNNTVLISLRNL